MAVKTFSTGEVLTAADTNTYLANAGLVYVTSTTVAAGSSSVQIDNCFTSTFTGYRITFAGKGTLANNDWLRARIVDGTTPQTGAIYFHSYAYSGTAAMATGFLGSQTSWLVGLIGDTATQCSWDLFNPQAAAKTTGVSGYMSSATNDYFNGNNGQLINNTTVYEGIQLYPSSGTFEGTVTIYGYRKA